MADQTTVEKKMTNGVDVMEFRDTIRAIQGRPTLAKFRFRTNNRWVTGGHNRSTITAFHGAEQEHGGRRFEYDNGEPPVLLGKDEGANPVEYVLHALAGCMTTTMAYHAAARGIRIESIESRLEGDIDIHGLLGLSDTIRSGYQNIRVSFKVKAAPGTDPGLLKQLTRMSPVFNTVSAPVPVDVDLTLV